MLQSGIMDTQIDQLGSTPTSGPTTPRTDRRVLLNTGALAGSSLWRIGISFLLQLYIASRLGAEGLGQYATALAFLNVAQVVSELGLPQLLVRDLARHPERRAHSFRAALAVQLMAGFLVWLGVIGLVYLVPYQPTTRLVLILMTGSLPFFAFTSVSATLFQAGERMEYVMGVEMVVNTLVLAAGLGVLWRGGGVVHLAVVQIGAQAVNALLFGFLLRRSGLLDGSLGNGDGVDGADLHGLNLTFLRDLWRQARPFYGLALTTVLLNRADILLLSALVGETITGIYSAAYLIVRVLIVLSQTYWRAIYPTLSRLRHQALEQYQRLAELALRYGLIALLPAAALSTDAAGFILGLIYRGEAYTGALTAYQVLIWAAPLFLTATYTVHLLMVEHYPQGSLMVAICHLLLVVLFLPALALRWQAVGAAGAVVASIGASVLLGFFLIRRVQVPVKRPTGLGVLLFATLLAAVGQRALNLLLPSPNLWPFSTLAGLIIYGVGLWQGRVASPADLALFRRALRRSR